MVKIPDTEKDPIKKRIASKMFTIGPATEIIPLVFLVTFPDIITAPGAANKNPKKDITIAIINILSNDLNSAKHPNLWATILWANSCNKKPIPTVIDDTIKA